MCGLHINEFTLANSANVGTSCFEACHAIGPLINIALKYFLPHKSQYCFLILVYTGEICLFSIQPNLTHVFHFKSQAYSFDDVLLLLVYLYIYVPFSVVFFCGNKTNLSSRFIPLLLNECKPNTLFLPDVAA